MKPLLPLLIFASACQCGNSIGISEACAEVPLACAPGETTCADHFACEPLSAAAAADAGVEGDAGCHVCTFIPRSCISDDQCCPGEVCNSSLGICFDCDDISNGNCGTSSCISDADCVAAEGPGHICAPFGFDGGPVIPGEPASQRCSYPSCATNADCANGANCFEGYCVLTPPCQGACAAGTACAVTDDFCSEVPADASSCQQSCGTGELLVFADQSVPSGIYDGCNLASVSCTCAKFPPITSASIGAWSALAADASDVWVSAYDVQFGDLVAYHFSLDGGLRSLDYIDGLPDGGALAGDPNGPRQGLAAPGPNVGQYTSIVLGTDGQPRIAYYDADHGALKYAARLGDGGWWTEIVDGPSRIDGGVRRVGITTSIAISPSGAPAISYLELDGIDGGEGSALDLAVATSSAPSGPTDWTLSTVQRAPSACNGACDVADGGQACVDYSVPLTDGGGCAVPPVGVCLNTSEACASCDNSSACVLVGDGGTCLPIIGAAATGNVPVAVGLESSLLFLGNGATAIAYGDRLHGALMLAQAPAGGAFQVATVDGRDPATCANTGSVGRFPSLRAASGGNLAIAYQDETRGVLLYWSGSWIGSSGGPSNGPFGQPISEAQRIVIDPGTLAPPDAGEDLPQIVGANASLSFGASGEAYVAYQDQTLVDLRLASLPAGCATATPSSCAANLLQEWASEPGGFSASLAITPNAGYVSNQAIHAGTGQLVLEGPLSLP